MKTYWTTSTLRQELISGRKLLEWLSSLDWRLYAGSVLVLMCMCLIVFSIYLLMMRYEVEKEVSKIPKVPMSECPKHGLFPSSVMLSINAIADDRQDLKVDICPFCYKDRLEASELLLKKG